MSISGINEAKPPAAPEASAATAVEAVAMIVVPCSGQTDESIHVVTS